MMMLSLLWLSSCVAGTGRRSDSRASYSQDDDQVRWKLEHSVCQRDRSRQTQTVSIFSTTFIGPGTSLQALRRCCCCSCGCCYQIFDPVRLRHFSADPHETFNTY